MKRLFLLALCLALPAAVQAQSAQTDAARQYLQAHAKQHGITGSALSDAVVTDAYTSRHNGVTHVYLQQHRNGIAVVDALVTVNVGPDGRVVHAGGAFVAGLEARSLAASPSLGAQAAAEAAAAHLGLVPTQPLAVQTRAGGPEQATVLSDGGIARLPVLAKLVYQPTGDDVRLAWDVEIHEAERPHVWTVRIDAATGAVLLHYDQVVHDHWPTPEPGPADLAPVAAEPGWHAPMVRPEGGFGGLTASYRVFPAPVESPSHGEHTLVTDPFDLAASPSGWHDDGTTTYTITRGNNVSAYDDRNNSNSPGYQPDGGSDLLFDFPFDPALSPLGNRDAAITNLFFWNNLIHDVFFQYGFDEAAGNFQHTNFSGEGFGNDPVQAEAQDGGGINNANFYTPPDGGCGVLGCFPRMQMYEWNHSSPRRDGDFDNGIIAHEYGHGISNRLTGGPTNVSCLNNSEQMGEGWSDFFGMVMTMNEGDTGEMRRGVGTYALNQPITGTGIRPAPYSTDMAINGFTYGAIGSQVVPHGVGFVWATMVWEMTWALIDRYGFDPDLVHGTGGNNIALQLVVDGLKMQPCSPGFIDGRDAILAADEALYDGANAVYIWEAFAKRGLGYSASQGSPHSTSDGTEAFDLPPGFGRFLELTATPDPVANHEFVTYTLTFGNGEARDPLANVELVAELPENAVYVGGSASDGGFLTPEGRLTWPGFEAPTGFEATRTFTVLADAEGETIVFFEDDMEDGDAHWSATHGTGSRDWSLNAGAGTDGSAGWFAADVGSFTDQYLTFAEPILLESDVNLQFTHKYATEANYDGGVVEVSTNGGSTWQDLGSRMTENGYNSTISTSWGSPIGGRQAFSGSSGGFIQTVVDMSDFTGEEVLVRFRMASDVSVGADGWYVDDVALLTAPINVAVEACAPDTETDCAASRVLVLGAVEPAPALTVSAGGFELELEAGTSTTVDLTLGNVGERALDWYLGSRLAVPAAWVSADAPSGTIEIDGTTTVTLTLDATDLADGVYHDTLAVYSNDPENLVVDLPVVLTVGHGVATEDGALPNGFLLTAAHPNPFTHRARFSLEVAEAQPVSVVVYDVMGREVARLHDGPLAAGSRHDFAVEGASLASGVYLVRVRGEHFAETKRLALVR